MRGTFRAYKHGLLLPRRLKVEVDVALLADLQFHVLRFNLGERSGFDDDVVNTRREVVKSIEPVRRCLGGADDTCFHVSRCERRAGYGAPCGSSARPVNVAKAELWPNTPCAASSTNTAAATMDAVRCQFLIALTW